MRAGVESDVVRLTLEVDDLGNITPTAQIEGNVVVGETIEIPDLYETHNVTAEARLDLAGMQVQPAEVNLRAAQEADNPPHSIGVSVRRKRGCIVGRFGCI